MNHPPSFEVTIQWPWYSWHRWRNVNGCGSVRNDVIFTSHFGSGVCPWVASPASCKTPATSIDSFCPNNHLGRNKKSWKKIKFPTNCIILPWATYAKARLREVDLEPSPKRGSDKINSLRLRRKNTTANKSYRTAWTHKGEPSTSRGRLGTQC